VHSDSAEALDEGSMIALIRLVLSTAFDVIYHLIQLKRLDMLKWNKDKTECIVFSFKQYVKKTENLCIKVGSSYIYSSVSVKESRAYIR